MILYKDMKAMVHTNDDDTNFYNIVIRDLQWDTLAPFLFIIYTDYILWISVDLMKKNSSKLKKQEADYIRQELLLTRTMQMS